MAALVKVRDDVLQRKGKFLDLVMEDLLSVLYLRIGGGREGGREGGAGGRGGGGIGLVLKEAGEREGGRGGGKAGGGGSIRLPPNLELTEAAERVVMEEGKPSLPPSLPASLPPSLAQGCCPLRATSHSLSPSLPPSLLPSLFSLRCQQGCGGVFVLHGRSGTAIELPG